MGRADMTLPEAVQRYLADRGVDVDLIPHSPTARIQQAADLTGVDRAQVARAVLLEAEGRLRLVVLPADRLLEFERLTSCLDADYDLAGQERVQASFPDCDPQTVPCLGAAYGIPVILDRALAEPPSLWLAVGRRDCLARVSGEAFRRLFEGCPWGSFSVPVQRSAVEELKSLPFKADNPYSPAGMEPGCMARLYALPPLPQTAQEILRLRDDPAASVDQLAERVEADPSLAAQVVRYARSPFFGYRGDIDGVREAIHRVLGFDLVVNMAVGLAAGRPFQIPAVGPLGLRAYWRHATLTAALAQQLSRRAGAAAAKPGLAYLAGLLHNFGFLLFGQLFRPEFTMLNRLAAANPEVPIVELERQVLTMGEARNFSCGGHARMGAWLMHAWGLPQEVVVSAAEHHRQDYAGEHAGYAGLVLVADRLARRLGQGDGDSAELPPAVLARLGLDEAVAEKVFERIAEAQEALDAMASLIAA